MVKNDILSDNDNEMFLNIIVIQNYGIRVHFLLSPFSTF